MTAPTPRETADHAELLERLRDASSGRSHAVWDRGCQSCAMDSNAIDQAADALENLLSEIAALRGDLTVARDDLDQLQAHFRQRDTEATQAERQRDEADALASKHFVALREKRDDAAVLKHGKLEAERQCAELRRSLSEIMPAVEAYMMTGEPMAQGLKKRTWRSAMERAYRLANQGAK